MQAGAAEKDVPLYKHLSDLAGNSKLVSEPVFMLYKLHLQMRALPVLLCSLASCQWIDIDYGCMNLEGDNNHSCMSSWHLEPDSTILAPHLVALFEQIFFASAPPCTA